MPFDPCEATIRPLVIKAAELLREAKGMPEEKNITILYEEIAPLLGLSIKRMSTKDIDHPPTFMDDAKQNPNSPWVIICPKCNEKSYVIHPICRGCKDSENGKYKTMFLCFRCNHKDRSEKPFIKWLNELGIEIPEGMKQRLGIRTVTDEGLK